VASLSHTCAPRTHTCRRTYIYLHIRFARLHGFSVVQCLSIRYTYKFIVLMLPLEFHTLSIVKLM
jgi:hypothetical protein